MKLTFKSADETFNVSLDIYSQTAVTDLTKIEKKLIGKDLTDIIQKVLDVAFCVTSQTFTRGPKHAYFVSYLRELHPIYEDNTAKSITVTVSDSDHSTYEFEGVEDRDIDAMITWLRKEHQVYYTPNDELLNEKKKLAEKVAKQQKKIDSYEATLSKITDIMQPKYAGPTWSETWDDLVERIKRLKTEHEDQLREANEELAEHRVAEGWLRKDNSDLAIDVANLKEELRVLRYDILEVYSEIFDCSNGDPEGTDEETLQDILTEYKRILKLKDVAEEKTIKYKELARENEERAAKYKDTAKENRVQWNNTNMQLQWAQKENLEWLKRYEKLKSELNEMKKSVDYKDAKTARAELAYLYKRILGEERLDPSLSPHEIAVAIVKHVQGLCDLQHEANMGRKELQKFRDEVYNALNLGYPTTNQYILKVLKERLTANDFYVEGIDAAEYRAFVMRLFEAVGKPVVEEIISTQYLAKMVLEEVKDLKRQNDSGTKYVRRMRELEQKLEDIKDICDGNSDVMNIIG